MPRLTPADAARLVDTSSTGRNRIGNSRHAARVPVRRESEIKRAILAYLRLVPGVRVIPMNVGAVTSKYKGKKRFVRFGAPGVSDILGWKSVTAAKHLANYAIGDVRCDACRTGDLGNDVKPIGVGPPHAHCVPFARFLAIEVKRPDRLPTPEQFSFLEEVKAAGGIAIVARSVEDVRKVLQP